MGIPKFFRWLSERYPMCSQLVDSHGVPEFDNFYLDMNGIIHTCSRAIASSGNPWTEVEMFLSIFAYVQALFEKIRPKKVLFLAVDGVAPRAKVNQQRSRRFRTAKEAQIELQKAARKDPSAVEKERFDSNCITPGTEFMKRMGDHLRYLIARRIAEDVTWRHVQVIFSGPEVPGEGEHKIMEYIRLSKAKPDYDPNVRHCLYGLDADLILLGLLSHDPHFALLREEVTFGRGAQTKKNAADTRFYLLHLCLMREYMEMEFRQLLAGMGGQFYLERLIDDFILLMCLVGNDFLPNIPHFHLGEGVLETLFAAYKRALPHFEAGESLNTNGSISFYRLALVLEELIDYEKSTLLLDQPSLTADSAGIHSKAKMAALSRDLVDNFLTVPTLQQWQCPTIGLTSKERGLVTGLATRANLRCRVEGNCLVLEKDPTSQIEAVLPKFIEETRELEELPSTKFQAAWLAWKSDYYARKVEFDPRDSPERLDQMMTSYAEGLQWVIRYYYEGVASWSWFYPYHYAPHISDLALFLKDFVCDPFNLAMPLRPLEQLMAVLPPASSKLLPKPLAQLMTSSESGVKHFYPDDFATDANGKKASWEAIVKIPFIDEQLLLPLMHRLYGELKEEELQRNEFGQTVSFEYRRPGTCLAAPSTDFVHFDDIPVHTVCYELPTLQPNERFVAALCKGVRLGLHAMPGFPTLATLPVSGILDSGIGLDIFNQPAKGLSLVLAVAPGGVFGSKAGFDLHKIAPRLIGKRVYMNWPHLREGLVSRVTDGCHTFETDFGNNSQHPLMKEADPVDADNFKALTDTLEREYKKKCAVLIGRTPAIAWIRPFMGMKMAADGSTQKQFSDQMIPVPIQTIVLKRVDANGEEVEDERYEEVASRAMDVSSMFPKESPVVYLGGGGEGYGTMGSVIELCKKDRNVRIRVDVRRHPEPIFPHRLAQEALHSQRGHFMLTNQVARAVGMSSLLVSKLTSSLVLFLKGDLVRSSNLGLEVKSEARKTATLGLSRKGSMGWEFSPKVVEILSALKAAFPDIVGRLEAVKQERNMDAAMVVPQATTRDELATAVAPWQYLIKLHLGKTVTVPLEGEFLPQAAIQTLREAWEDYKSRGSTKKETAEILASAELLLSPLTATARLHGHQQQFSLGHRIVHLGSGVVPFGARGIVVGRVGGKLWVLLDSPSVGAGDLEGLLEEEGSGAILDESVCLNLNWIQAPLGAIQPVDGDVRKLGMGLVGKAGHFKSVPKAPAPNKPAWRPKDPTTSTKGGAMNRPRFAILAKKPDEQAKMIVPGLSAKEADVASKPNPTAHDEPSGVRRSIKIEDLFAATSISGKRTECASTLPDKASAVESDSQPARSIIRVEYRQKPSVNASTTPNGTDSQTPTPSKAGSQMHLPSKVDGYTCTLNRTDGLARITYDSKKEATKSSKGLLAPDLQRLPPRS